MYIRKSIYWLLFAYLVLCSSNGFSMGLVGVKPSSQLQYSLDYLRGHSTYEIGGLVCDAVSCRRAFFPFSKLEFPIDIFMAQIAYQKKLPKATLRASFSASIKDRTGTFRDSDYVFAPGSLDIYSESKSNAKAVIVSASIEKFLLKDFNSNTTHYGADVTLQHFKFDVRDTNQVSTVPGFCTCFIAGPTITYDVSYFIPSAFIRTRLQAYKDLEFDAKFALSPLTIVLDKDNHLARSKISKGELYGFSYSFAFSAIFHLNKAQDVVFGIHTRYIDTTGTQTQVQPNELDTDVDEIVYSSQHSIKLSLHTSF